MMGSVRVVVLSLVMVALLLFVVLPDDGGGCDRTSEAGEVPENVGRVTVTTNSASSLVPRPLVAIVDDGMQEDGPLSDVEMGRQLYLTTCVTCHGAQGQGMPRQGMDLRTSTMLADPDDEKLLAFLKTGRQANDPANKMGLLMPPRGGNAAIGDADLRKIIRFLRTIPRAEASAGQ